MQVWTAAFFYGVAVALATWIMVIHRREPGRLLGSALAGAVVAAVAGFVLVGSAVSGPREVFFYFFAAATLAGAVLTVSARHPVYASVWLLMTAAATSGVLVVLRVEIVATVMLLLQAGVVTVFYVSAVMMVEVPDKPTPDLWLGRYSLATLAGVALFVGMCGMLARVPELPTVLAHDGATITTARIGSTIADAYALPFLLTGVLLLTAMAGAIYSSRRDADVETRGAR